VRERERVGKRKARKREIREEEGEKVGERQREWETIVRERKEMIENNQHREAPDWIEMEKEGARER
jgi:hypothetical protein